MCQGNHHPALFDEDGVSIDEVRAGERGYVALARTPFYLEAGGQVSDTGRMFGADGSVAVVERLVRTAPNRPRLHLVSVERGSFRRDQIATAEVADAVRDATRRNHTATHLLHAALREVLGAHVKQAGSLVAPDRLRFDFVHVSALSVEEIERIERLVNEHVYRNIAVQTEIRSMDDAIAAGAMALFGEKYGDRVRVVSVPGFSMELCGGTHVRATGDIGFFVITEEGGVAAGVRRIEALTGAKAVEWAQRERRTATGLLKALNTTAPQAVDAVQRLQADHKKLLREVEQLRVKAALSGQARADDPAGAESSRGSGVQQVSGVNLIARRAQGLDKAALRGVSDSLRDTLRSGVVVLASEQDGKVAILVSVTKDLTGRVQAGQMVKALAPIVGGGGGGRPDFAEAGGRDATRIDELLARAPDVLQSLLASPSSELR
jgi:alanyl-tRNA synthetase